MYKAANTRPDCGLVIGAGPVTAPVSDPVPDPASDPANKHVMAPDYLFFLAFVLFVTVLKHGPGASFRTQNLP